MTQYFGKSAPIDRLDVAAYKIPTEAPESDGTLTWDATTLVVVHLGAAGQVGLGYTYADTGTASIIDGMLRQEIEGADVLAIPAAHRRMQARLRNLGVTGPCAMAIAAVDNALWDLKARILQVPLATLLGAVRRELPVYGSGGFTSYSDSQLRAQLSGWLELGILRVKIKVGREPERDPARVKLTRETIGSDVELFVDANSAYSRKEALYFCRLFAGEFDVRWMEQPLPPEDVEGMAWLREVSPERLEIADGEYGYDGSYFLRRLRAGAVDVLMVDASRAQGVTGFLQAGALCDSFHLPLSSHCAPSLHLHPGCAVPAMRHAEYFHDHVRIESMLFEGFRPARDGAMAPDWTRPGSGLEFKFQDAEAFAL